MSLGFGVGAAFSLAFRLGETLGLDYNFLEFFYLVREILIAPFAYLNQISPVWLKWIFRRELGLLYSFAFFLLPFFIRGYEKWQIHRDYSTEESKSEKEMFRIQVAVVNFLLIWLSFVALYFIWLGPAFKFFLRSLIELILYGIILSGIFIGGSHFYSQIVDWKTRNLANGANRHKLLLYDAVRAVFLAGFVSIATVAIGIAVYLLWISGGYVTYLTIYGLIALTIVAAFDDWRTIPAIMVSSLCIVLGNVFIETLVGPSWQWLNEIVAKLPRYEP